jgi:hypothetical protein
MRTAEENGMSPQRFFKAIVVAAALMMAVPAAAQTVTNTDIQRLQDDVFQASSDIARLRSTDAATAGRLQDQLDDLRDEVVYLKVKLRKDGSVSRSDYNDLRARVLDVRSQALGGRTGTVPPRSNTSTSTQGNSGVSGRQGSSTSSGTYDSSRPATTSSRTEIPSGQEIDVRLERALSSATAQVEDRFQATTVVDLYEGNRVLIPAGSVMRGVVSSVDKASRTDRKGSLTVSFDQVTVRGRDYPMRGTVTEAIESEGIKGEAAKIGAGSAVGAIIGGIIGGVKGAVLGVLIGGGGTIAATEGTDVNLPPGTILRVRLDTPPDIR